MTNSARQKMNHMSLAPVVIFSYNRPDHLRKVLLALSQNELAEQSVLYIYCDGAKPNATEEEKVRITKNREVACSANGFKEVHIIERKTNYGLASNIVGAVTEIVFKYGKVITLEDDVITSKGFLTFMNKGLDVYEAEERVMHISSYMWPHRYPLPQTFFYPLPYPGGGWATWARAWKHYEDNIELLFCYWKDRWKEFDIVGGDYLSSQLIANYNGSLKSWFIKWHAVLLIKNGVTLFPGKSLTNNIGFDEMATNCGTTKRFNIDVLAEKIKVRKKKVRINWLAAQEIYAFYQGRWYNKRRRTAFLNSIKRTFLHHA